MVLLCNIHCSKCFTYIDSFNSHDDFNEIDTIIGFMRHEETEAQVVTWPRALG